MGDLLLKRKGQEDFDFRDIQASTGIYGIHPYPAMFHFLVVRELLQRFSSKRGIVLDPFMGSGVVAGECLISERNFIGYDINPLAVLVAKARTTPIGFKILLESVERILKDANLKSAEPVEFFNIHYWFDEQVISELSKLRQAIFEIEEPEIRDFSKVVFSETVRKVSKTEFSEFKLLRKKEEKTKPNVLGVFKEIFLRNTKLLTEFYAKFPPTNVSLVLEERNVLDGIPIDDESVDVVITSPPYGDSKTTVAYGQFSRLSLNWLGAGKNIDSISLGSKPKEISYTLPSEVLYKIVKEIREKNEKRAKEVFSFYHDLYEAVKIISRKVKRGGYVCFVVGNRRVSGIELPTDKISVDFFESQGFKHKKTIVREISNKRMPIQNAPSNIKGKRDFTMKHEYIVILEKKHVY